MKRGLRKAWQWRLRILQGVFMLLLLLLGSRFYDLQVRQHKYFKQKAERQYQRRVRLVPHRGAILDRNRHELAVSVDADSVYAVPARFKNQSRIGRLAAILGLDSQKLTDKLTSSRSFVWLKRQLTPKQAAAVRELKLSGIGFIRESRRYYPQKQLAANLLGFVGTDNQGLEGIERYYEDWIRGKVQVVDVAAEGANVSRQLARPGFDLILTLDKTIQYIAQTELSRACREFKARQGVVVMMDPQTGELLAMASEPKFNPNSFGKYGPGSWRNRAITDCYEPGSVLKVFIAAAALEERLFSPRDSLWCEQGAITVAGHTIHDNASYGKLSFSRVIEVSSNVGAVKIGLALGRKRIYDYLRRFGFGLSSGIDLPGERSGVLRPPERWSAVSIGSISIGQELSVTPLQLVNAVCAIANGGLLLKPRVVGQIWDGKRQRPVKEYKRQVVRRVVSARTCRELTRILVRVVERGSGQRARLVQYKVAGKTGSAQKVDPETGAYAGDKWVAWFLGFAPADRPRLAMVVMLDEPQRGKWAAEVTAPVFARIARKTLRYLGVPPDRSKPKKKPVPQEARRLRLVKYNSSKGGDEGRLVVLPDLRGKSMRRVARELSTRGLLVELVGSGRAISQDPPPGAKISPGSICRVNFTPLYGNE
jgi:cell division protein FtsI (penicillin-binding protein 3)